MILNAEYVTVTRTIIKAECKSDSNRIWLIEKTNSSNPWFVVSILHVYAVIYSAVDWHIAVVIVCTLTERTRLLLNTSSFSPEIMVSL